MSVTMRRVMLMACLLSPSMSWALGLGEIHLNSALNEPMNAEIDLISVAPDELAAVRATLASREAFTRYGIDKPAFLSSLTFKVGKGKDGRDSLLVRSAEAVPEPFVTFLVEVNWARGRLLREYTVLLDPPVYTPGGQSGSAASGAAPSVRRPAPNAAADEAAAPSATASGSPRATTRGDATVRVGPGDTLTRIAHNLHIDSSGLPVRPDVDQTMIALYRANPEAFGGNINLLRQGAILRVPETARIAALDQKEAKGEVRRQMDAWRSGGGAAASSGHLRLVTPSGGGSATGTGTSSGENPNSSPETAALKDRVKELEAQLAESKRLIDIRSSELSALQSKLGAVQTPAAPPAAVPPAAPPVAVPTPTPAPSTAAPTAGSTGAPPAPAASAAESKKPAASPLDFGAWLDWVAANWWIPLALLVLVIGGLAFAAMKRRRDDDADMNRLLDETDVADRNPPYTLGAQRGGHESFVVEESSTHPAYDFGEVKSPDDTLSNESAVNLDQGDPLAEADFHMAYGLYDQAADLILIALEREPDRRDLRLKLLEIYFVWGNKDAFLQTAKGLAATRDRAPAGEWDKIVIMGKQICPDEPMFGVPAGSSRGAGALVDLNLEGGENRVDIDLFGDPEGERSSLGQDLASETDDAAATGGSPGRGLHADDGLDFTLDAPERGADESPTRAMPPHDAPMVESELMDFGHENFIEASGEEPTIESPALRGADGTADLHDRISSKLPTQADQTAEVSIDDLGLDLDDGDGDHPSSDAPTVVAGLDKPSRRMLEEAHKSSRDRDLTDLERELEASFAADLDTSCDDFKTSGPGPSDADQSPTSRFQALQAIDIEGSGKDLDSTSRLKKVESMDLDLDLDRLASALGSSDTVDQPRAEEDLFSSEVFEESQHDKLVDLDVGEPMVGSDAPTIKLQAQTNKLKPVDLAMPDMETVTMSEVGTKLDLARAYMDMGDPEGARSILEEVVQEGSANQKQEASRLIESLPG